MPAEAAGYARKAHRASLAAELDACEKRLRWIDVAALHPTERDREVAELEERILAVMAEAAERPAALRLVQGGRDAS